MADMEQQAEYLQAHGLDKVLEALVVETMQHQPEDPFDYMSQQMFKMAESFSQLTAHAAASAGGAAPAAKEDGWWTKWKGPRGPSGRGEVVSLSGPKACDAAPPIGCTSSCVGHQNRYGTCSQLEV